MVCHTEKVQIVLLFVIKRVKFGNIVLWHVFQFQVWHILLDYFEIHFYFWYKLSDPPSAGHDCFFCTIHNTWLGLNLHTFLCLWYLCNFGILLDTQIKMFLILNEILLKFEYEIISCQNSSLKVNDRREPTFY